MTTYNFARGHPNNDLVPVLEMKTLLTQIGSSCDDEEEALRNSLNYGDEQGQADLLQELAAFLQRQCVLDQGTSNTGTNSFFITGGVSHDIELLCSVATKPGDTVWVEDPTYFLAAELFQSHGLRIELLPMRQAGVVDVEALEEQLRHPDSVAPPRLIYIIPTHQNPTGCTMSLPDRTRLAVLAYQYNILVVADEVYHLLDYRDGNKLGQRPARMAMFHGVSGMEESLQSIASDANVDVDQTTASRRLFGCCSVSSFTKIFCPGVRLGWVEAPIPIIQALKQYGYIVSQGGVAPFMGHLFCRALRQRVCDGVLDKLCLAYAHRVHVLVRILEQEPRIHMPCRPTGGYFLWLILPFDADSFLDYCQIELTFLLGIKCRASEQQSSISTSSVPIPLAQSVRLCFAYLDLDCLESGAMLFLSKFRSYTDRLLETQPVDDT